MAQTVLPPKGAQSANDMYGIELPRDVEQANWQTHCFGGSDMRCGNCDSRSGGEWARFACQYDGRLHMSYEEWLVRDALADITQAVMDSADELQFTPEEQAADLAWMEEHAWGVSA
jgi:hypothetical protein